MHVSSAYFFIFYHISVGITIGQNQKSRRKTLSGIQKPIPSPMVAGQNCDRHPNLETNFLSGMLLYARTTAEAEQFISVKMGGNRIDMRSLNLASMLDGIAFACFGPSLKKLIRITPCTNHQPAQGHRLTSSSHLFYIASLLSSIFLFCGRLCYTCIGVQAVGDLRCPSQSWVAGFAYGSEGYLQRGAPRPEIHPWVSTDEWAWRHPA